MRCPVCGARVLVLETRHRKTEDYVYRRYECFNLHRFVSKEVVVKVITKDEDNETRTG